MLRVAHHKKPHTILNNNKRPFVSVPRTQLLSKLKQTHNLTTTQNYCSDFSFPSISWRTKNSFSQYKNQTIINNNVLKRRFYSDESSTHSVQSKQKSVTQHFDQEKQETHEEHGQNSQTTNKETDTMKEETPKRKWGLLAYLWLFLFLCILFAMSVIGYDAYTLAEIKRKAVEEIRNDPKLLRQLNKYIGYSILYDTGFADMSGIATYVFSTTLDSHLGTKYSGRGRPFSIRVKGSRGEGMLLCVHNSQTGEFTDFVLVKGGGELPPIPLRSATIDNEKGHNSKMLLRGMQLFVEKQLGTPPNSSSQG